MTILATMKSVQLTGPGTLSPTLEPYLTLEDVPQGHSLIRLELAGICGSDRPGFITGANEAGETPAGFPVHECVGTVAYTTGDPSLAGKRVIAIPNDDAGLSEYFLAPLARTYALGSPLPSSTSVLIQPLATILAAAERLGPLAGARIAIIGLGPIGLMFGYVLRALGAGHIAGFDRQDRSQAPLASCLDLSSTGTPPPQDFDIVIDAVGHAQAPLNLAIHAARHRGIVMAFGVPDDEVYAVEFKSLFRKSLTMVASVQPQWQKYFPLAEDFLTTHAAELAPLVTHTFDVSQTQAAFEMAFTHDDPARGKVLITTDSWHSKEG